MALRGRRDEQAIAELRELELFSLADDDELRLVLDLGHVVDAPEGTALTEESEFQGGDFFVILDGTATVSRGDEELRTLERGAFFGEMAALELRKRSATVTADSPMQLLVFDRSAFDQLLTDAQTFTRRLLREMGRRLRDMEASHH
jgi:CRP-like cAMP-binding protein